MEEKGGREKKIGEKDPVEVFPALSLETACRSKRGKKANSIFNYSKKKKRKEGRKKRRGASFIIS